MAIYDVDAINEQELAAERDDILDNMLEACDQMLSALDEHGGARNKYVDIMRDKSWKNTMKGIHANGYDYPENELAKKYFDLSEKQRAEANKYRNLDKMYSGERDDKESREGKERFMKDFGGPSGKKLGHDKPGEIKALQDKKRSIKETCLTILSVLDEI